MNMTACPGALQPGVGQRSIRGEVPLWPLSGHSPFLSHRGNLGPKGDTHRSLTLQFTKTFSVPQILLCLLWSFFEKLNFLLSKSQVVS